MERCDRVNKLNCILDRYTKGQEWMSSVGSAMGYTNNYESATADRDDWNSIMPTGDTVATVPTGADVRTYSIPLSSVSSLFRSYDKLLPSHLMSGCRFEIGKF